MHPRRLEKHANITLNSALFQIETNETKRSTSYFLGIKGSVSSRFKSAVRTNFTITRETLYCTRVHVSFTSARSSVIATGFKHIVPSRKRLARQFLVAPSESYLPGRGADFGQVLVSTVSR